MPGVQVCVVSRVQDLRARADMARWLASYLARCVTKIVSHVV